MRCKSFNFTSIINKDVIILFKNLDSSPYFQLRLGSPHTNLLIRFPRWWKTQWLVRSLATFTLECLFIFVVICIIPSNSIIFTISWFNPFKNLAIMAFLSSTILQKPSWSLFFCDTHQHSLYLASNIINFGTISYND